MFGGNERMQWAVMSWWMGARKFSKNAREPKEKEQEEEITEHEKKVMLNANFPRRRGAEQRGSQN